MPLVKHILGLHKYINVKHANRGIRLITM